MASAIWTAFMRALYGTMQGFEALFDQNSSRPDLARDLLEVERPAPAPMRTRRPRVSLRNPGDLRIVRAPRSSVRV